jgi:hypothetical protein
MDQTMKDGFTIGYLQTELEFAMRSIRIWRLVAFASIGVCLFCIGYIVKGQ